MKNFEVDRLQNLTEEQHKAALTAISSPIGILRGSAGTGKSWTTARILQAVRSGVRVQMVAPTGKAATRANELLVGAGLQPICTTIHSAMEPMAVEGDDGDVAFAFTRHAGNPLECDLLVVDESSMVDADLFDKLLSATRDHCQILLVGDPNQLPPVGAGCPYLDLIESGHVPVGTLSSVHRYSGRTGVVCNAIINGDQWEPSEKIDLDLESPENFRIINTPNDVATQRTVVDVCRGLRDRGMTDSLVRDVFVATALNANLPVSRKDLNEKLRPLFNPGFQADRPYSRGDRVICKKNSWLKDSDGEERYVANGDIGVVRDIPAKGPAAIVEFWNPQRVVEVPAVMRHEIELAYAMTVHKLQGSSAPFVVVATSGSYGYRMVAKREWTYTALSRSEKATIVVGSKSHLDGYCQQRDIVNRKTFFKERIGYELSQLQEVAE